MLKLSSHAFSQDGAIPSRYTCDGENISPPMTISGVPDGAHTLALIMEDPDVPVSIRSDGMWDHWMLWNIAPDTAEIPEAAAPGEVGANTGGKHAYAGPCPPDREHRYFFTLYALDNELALKSGASKAALLQAMEGHVLARATFMARYERQR
jgi:Raf kinase inhibitor-like YbhB/YbcL family protein